MCGSSVAVAISLDLYLPERRCHDAQVSLELADQVGDLPRVAEDLHGLRVRVVAEAERTLDGAGELPASKHTHVH